MIEDEADRVAYHVFVRLLDQFEWRGDSMTGVTMAGLPLERVKIAAEALGFELTENLLDKVQAMSLWFRDVHKPVPKPASSERVN